MSVTFYPSDGNEELSINLSNINAAELLREFGRFDCAEELCGHWNLQDMKGILNLISFALEKNLTYPFEKETEIEGNFIYIGRDQKYVTDRLSRFKKLIEYAIDNNLQISFA